MRMINRGTSRLYGIVNVDIDDISSGETRDFSLSMVGDYSDVDFFEVTVNDRNTFLEQNAVTEEPVVVTDEPVTE